jgi:predicted nucleic acid-binding Zn ribbon protein
MPTYVYRDPQTGDEKEVFHSMSETPVIVNEKTGNTMERVISGGAGFLFKGDGFYITDHRSASYKAGEKSDGAHTCSSAGCCHGGACSASE